VRARFLLAAAFVLASAASAPLQAAPENAAPAAGPDASGGKKIHSSIKKAAGKSKRAPSAKTAGNKNARVARQKAAHPAAPATINDEVTITPFPSQASAAKKALAQNRRDQLDDAEKAARSPAQDDRWATVLFHLRNLDARSDPEGCFWRLVAYYRLGQVERARTLKQNCELAPRDEAAIAAEDAQAGSLQPAVTLAQKEPPPVANPAPYAGTGPARVDR
jgi:hypothetical protein